MEVRAQLQNRTSLVDRRGKMGTSLVDLMASVSSVPGSLNDDLDVARVWVYGEQIYMLSHAHNTLRGIPMHDSRVSASVDLGVVEQSRYSARSFIWAFLATNRQFS